MFLFFLLSSQYEIPVYKNPGSGLNVWGNFEYILARIIIPTTIDGYSPKQIIDFKKLVVDSIHQGSKDSVDLKGYYLKKILPMISEDAVEGDWEINFSEQKITDSLELGIKGDDIDAYTSLTNMALSFLSPLLFFVLLFLLIFLYTFMTCCIACCCCGPDGKSKKTCCVHVAFIIGIVLFVIAIISQIVAFFNFQDLVYHSKNIASLISHSANNFNSSLSDIQPVIDETVESVGDLAFSLIPEAIDLLDDCVNFFTPKIDLIESQIYDGNDSLMHRIDLFEDQMYKTINSIQDLKEKYESHYGSEPFFKSLDFEINLNDARDVVRSLFDTIKDFLDYAKDIKDDIKPFNETISDFYDDIHGKDLLEELDIYELVDNYSTKEKVEEEIPDIKTISETIEQIEIGKFIFLIFALILLIFVIFYIYAMIAENCCAKCIINFQFCEPCLCSILFTILGLIGVIASLVAVVITKQLVPIGDAAVDALADALPERKAQIPDSHIVINNTFQDVELFANISIKDITFKFPDSLQFFTKLLTQKGQSIESILSFTKFFNLQHNKQNIHSIVSWGDDYVNPKLTDFMDSVYKNMKDQLPENLSDLGELGVESINTTIKNVTGSVDQISDDYTDVKNAKTTAKNDLKKLSQLLDGFIPAYGNVYNNLNDKLFNYINPDGEWNTTYGSVISPHLTNLLTNTSTLLSDLMDKVLKLMKVIKTEPISNIYVVISNVFFYDILSVFSSFAITAHLTFIGFFLISFALFKRKKALPLPNNSEIENSSEENSSLMSSDESSSQNNRYATVRSNRRNSRFDSKTNSDNFDV